MTPNVVKANIIRFLLFWRRWLTLVFLVLKELLNRICFPSIFSAFCYRRLGGELHHEPSISNFFWSDNVA